MHNPLPTATLHEVFYNSKFDEFLEAFKEFLGPLNGLKVKVFVDGNPNGSDIKWNNFSGQFRLSVVDKEGKERVSLLSTQIDCFTGNCGVKSIDHLHLQAKANTHKGWDSEYKTAASRMLEVLESFLYHKTNCGLLVGSDTYVGPTYRGRTIMAVEEYGSGYKIGEPTWNPNYTWDTKHRIALFQKDLNGTKHHDFWSK
jgi:hypothetical protein